MLLTLIALAVAAPVEAVPQVKLLAARDGYSATAPSFQSKSLPMVEGEVNRLATSTCSGQQIDWGQFTWTEDLGKRPGIDIATIKNYRRDFRCLAKQSDTQPRAPDDWTASPADEADVRRFFATYFATRDTGQVDLALKMFEPGVVGDPKGWAKDVAAFTATLGKGSRRIAGVTWYVNPAQASQPGVYAAIDYIGNYPNFHFYCGYLGLYRRGPGSYGIVHEEQNMFSRTKEATDPAQVTEMRAAMCREGQP